LTAAHGCPLKACASSVTLSVVHEVVALTMDDVPAAGALLAARHGEERERLPLLPAAFQDADAASGLVREVLAFCDGVAAVDGSGRLVGFLTSFDSAPDPASPMARYTPARSVLHLVHGHAVAAGVAPGPVYAALYAALAERAVERGITDQMVHVPMTRTALVSYRRKARPSGQLPFAAGIPVAVAEVEAA
jgi:hypothetical protein